MSGGILAIRPRALGDVVLTTPALRALRRGHTGAPLDVATEARYAGLIEGLPGIRSVLPMARGAAAGARLLREVRRRRYAVVVDFFGNPRTALLAWASGAGRTVGWDVRGRRYAYRERVPRVGEGAGGRGEYAAASSVRLACAAGGLPDGLETRVSIPDPAHAAAARLLESAGIRDPGRSIGLVAAGTWPAKTWPASHAGWFARALLGAGREVLVLAGPGEARVTESVRVAAPGVKVLPACDVPSLAAVIGRLGGVAGTDSGPRHLAAALGVPTFSWFGPTNPAHWTPPQGPHGVWWAPVPCRGCNLTSCVHWTCLPSLHPERAAELALRHFDGHESKTSDFGPPAGA